MEIEIGVVGGEEDGVANEINDKLYTTPGDALRTVEVLGAGENGRYLLAATFGNVHGVYKPGNVKLRPPVLKDIQERGRRQGRQGEAVRPGLPRRLRVDCSRRSARPLDYGVVKMNVDTDTQYAFTRPVADHMFTQLRRRAQGRRRGRRQEAYDPRAWGKAAEAGMAARVAEACEDLRSSETTLGAQ